MADKTMVTFKKGLISNLPDEITNGVIYVTTDECGMYVDIDGKRIRIGDFQEFSTLTALQANTNPSATTLYYVTELNCMAKWDGEKYIQINLDTGATSIDVVGDGNAVTAASYNPATRKLTLTAGATYTTADDVQNAIAALDLENTYETKGAADTKDEAIAAAKKSGDDAQAAVDILVGGDTGKSARAIANEELAKQLIPENAKESLDTLAEIAAWIQSHPDDATAMNKTISELAAFVGVLPEDAGAATIAAYIKEYVDAAVAALNIGDYAKAADLTAAVARIASLEADSHTHTNKLVLDNVTEEKITKWDSAEQNAKNYTDDAITWGTF